MAAEAGAGERDVLLRLDRLTVVAGASLLAAFAVLLAWGLFLSVPHHASNWPVRGGSDAKLYQNLIRDVRAGASYYAVAPDELRRAGFPVRPFLAVRPPFLTVALSQLPDAAARYLALAALAAVTWAAWAWRLWPRYRDDHIRYAWALALLASGLAPTLSQGVYLFHEAWAGVLIALAIAIRGPRLWILSVGAGLLAALIRELSFPFLGVMALFAWRDGRRGESAVWIGALGVALIALARHAAAVEAVTRAGDMTSPGWLAVSGYPFILHLAQLNMALLNAPLWASALALPTALLGLLFWSGGGAGRGARAAFTVAGYALGFCFIGRLNNDYWGLLIAALWPLGLIEADRVVSGLLALSFRRRSQTAPAVGPALLELRLRR